MQGKQQSSDPQQRENKSNFGIDSSFALRRNNATKMTAAIKTRMMEKISVFCGVR